MARARKQLDFQALAAALTDPSVDPPDMAGIARRLGVAKPTLYRMTGSREELIALSIDAEAERLLEAMHHDGTDGFFTFVADNPAGFLLLFGGRYPASRQAVRRVENRVRDGLRRDPDRREDLGPADVANVAAGIVALAAAIGLRAVESGRPIKAERLRSDFDVAAKLAARISDTGSVETTLAPT